MYQPEISMKILACATALMLFGLSGCGGDGSTGAQGVAGPPGPQGPIGTQGPAGIQGPVGPAGAVGATGPVGARGLSAWDTIPSGMTVSGEWFASGVIGENTNLGEIEFSNVYIAYPALAPLDLASADIVTDQFGSKPDPGCNGGWGSLVSPPGKVCIYPSIWKGVASITGSPSVFRNRGFFVTVKSPPKSATAPAGTYFRASGSWVYTAP